MQKSNFATTRRDFVRLGLAAAATGLAGTVDPLNSFAARADKGANVLVVYFSHSGNTRAVAELIHERVGGTLVEIRPAKPYPSDYDTCVDLAKKEQQKKARPAILTEIPDMEKYSTVFLGYPCWWGTMPMPVFTFLEKYDMAGKNLAPFTTHGGSGMGTSESDLARLCPRAHLLKGLAVRGRNARKAGPEVDAWLQSIVF